MKIINNIKIKENKLFIDYNGDTYLDTSKIPNIRGYIGNGEDNCQKILSNFSFDIVKGSKDKKYIIPDIYNEIILSFVIRKGKGSELSFVLDLSNLMRKSYYDLNDLIEDLTTWKNTKDIYNREKKIILSLGGGYESWVKYKDFIDNTTAYINALKNITYDGDGQVLPDIIGKGKLIDGFDIDYETGGFPGDQLYQMCQYMYTIVNETKDLYYWSSSPEPALANNSSIYAYSKSGLMESLDLTAFQCYNNTPGGYNTDEKDFLAKYNISNYGSGGDDCCPKLYNSEGLCDDGGWFNPPEYDKYGWSPKNKGDGYINGYYGGGWQIEYPPKGIKKDCFTCKAVKTEAYPETKQYWQLMYESLMCSYNCNKGSSYKAITSSENINCCTSTDSSCLKLGLLLPLSPIASSPDTNDINATLRYDYVDFLTKIKEYTNLTTIGGWCIEQDIWYDNFLKGNIISTEGGWTSKYGTGLKNINKDDWVANTPSGAEVISFSQAVHKVYD